MSRQFTEDELELIRGVVKDVVKEALRRVRDLDDVDASIDDEPAPRSIPAPATLVYFVQVGESGPIKIGKTNDVSARIRSLQTAQAEELRLIATISVDEWPEWKLHQLFAEHRLRGEWFEPAPVLEWISKFPRTS